MEVKMLAYDNPTGGCQGCLDANTDDDNGSAQMLMQSCCDALNITSTTQCTDGENRCDSYFTYCLRPYGTLEESDCSTYENMTSAVNTDDGPLDFSQSTVLGLPNPLKLPGLKNDYKVSVVVN